MGMQQYIFGTWNSPAGGLTRYLFLFNHNGCFFIFDISNVRPNIGFGHLDNVSVIRVLVVTGPQSVYAAQHSHLKLLPLACAY